MQNRFLFFGNIFEGTGFTQPGAASSLFGLPPSFSNYAATADQILINDEDLFLIANAPRGHSYPTRQPGVDDATFASSLFDQPVTSFQAQDPVSFSGFSVRLATPLSLAEVIFIDWTTLLAGDDRFELSQGDDVAQGGPGDDVLEGLEGDDAIFGDTGRDTLKGDQGDDFLDGGANGDLIEGGSGNDILLGRGGADVVRGGGGKDTILTGKGADTVEGGGGKDSITTGKGADQVRGNGGNDALGGGNQGDTLLGQAGHDTIFGDQGADLLSGGAGHDNIGGIFDPAGSSTRTEAGNDTLQGGAGDDFLFGGTGRDLLEGGTGLNTLVGGRGQDTLDATTGTFNELAGGAEVDGNASQASDDAPDTFRFSWDAGNFNRILDFERGVDRIELVDPEGRFDDFDFAAALDNSAIPNARLLSFGDTRVAIFSEEFNLPTEDDILDAIVIVDMA